MARIVAKSVVNRVKIIVNVVISLRVMSAEFVLNHYHRTEHE